MEYGCIEPVYSYHFWQDLRRRSLSFVTNIADIENIITLRQGGETRVLHARDGYDRTLELSSIEKLHEHFEAEDIKDMWRWIEQPEEQSEKDILDDMFDSDYPRSPPTQLGLLLKNGAIYQVHQEPFSIREITTPEKRHTFLHALIRSDHHSSKHEEWPAVVFQQQPNTIYRVATLADLLAWLAGETVAFRVLKFTHPIVRPLDDRYRNDTSFALLESGHVYYWDRSGESGISEKMSLVEALSSYGRLEASASKDRVHVTVASAPCSRTNLPPVSKISLGRTIGAVTRQTGALYVFATGQSVGVNGDIYTPHLIDLDDNTADHRISPPYDPKEASINHDIHPDSEVSGPKFVDVAVGEDHVVVLAADGRVFAAGSAFQGQLGVGERQFALDDKEPQCYEWSHGTAQYSESWQQVDIPSVMSQQQPSRQVYQIAAGYESTLFVVGDRKL